MALDSQDIDRLYGWFKDTISFCDHALSTLDGDTLTGVIYEDFVLSVDTFFQPQNLEYLLQYGLINESTQKICLQVADDVMDIVTNKPTSLSVRNDPDWQKIFSLMNRLSHSLAINTNLT